ncbi:penicillin-binding protein 1A [Iodidimonas nitroreducens]|uniref:Penicillin-binding protein 1A n=2 Tax=Iodidimonas nitroreducens TaxID=1236968 RepID=A0A5A7N599_9PROT|nr:penicillin-binding protein 1A [Iodidimonas nitroreducens]
MAGFGGMALFSGLLLAGGVIYALLVYGRDLPDYRQLADYEPPVMTRVHAGDGSVLAEFATEKRLFIPIEVIPKRVVHAFLSAEDKNFYQHPGLDFMGIARAMVMNVRNVFVGRRPVGASTITQQVAKNFLLTNEVSYERKIKEAILAFRIEKAFSKDRILELYLNEILFGYGSYGLAAAALNYFDKSVDELTLAESAYLAALPKAPYNYHPIRRKEAAIGRRNWVLGQMQENGYISKDAMQTAQAQPLDVRPRSAAANFRADYYEEAVRRHLARDYGTDELYGGGLSVRTSLEPRLQAIAEKAMHDGLIAYDRRHGWRGPITQRSIEGDWPSRLAAVPTMLGMADWQMALVHDVRAAGAVIGLVDGSYGFIPFDEMRWARRWLPGERVSQSPDDPADVLSIGDVIAVEPLPDQEKKTVLDRFVTDAGEPVGAVGSYALRQIPAVEGALVALDPHTGRVLAMVGGFDFAASQFNRATQAERQPGSAFKPFVYAAALEEGFTPSSLVLDAPFVIDQGEGQGKWKPRNSSNRFYGPSTLRLGLEKSRNLMTIRVAQFIGMDKVLGLANRFGLAQGMEPNLAHALGAGEVTPIDLTAAYAMLVNGGKKIEPSLIDRIQDRYGKTIMRNDQRDCPQCDATEWHNQAPPTLPDHRPQIIDPRIAYQVVHMLEGVVERGTGRRIRSVGIPLAGKTGTTNESFDAWFVGFAPDLAVGVFVGFDQPRSLGPGEEGSSAAAPIFRDFMAKAFEGEQGIPFRIPQGVRLVRVDAQTGVPARLGDQDVILEAFIPGTEPSGGDIAVLDGPGSLALDGRLRKGTGGLY